MKRTEAETRAEFIDPLLKQCGWEHEYIRREYHFTDGRKLFGGKRGERCFVDYLLQYNRSNLAIVWICDPGYTCFQGSEMIIFNYKE